MATQQIEQMINPRIKISLLWILLMVGIIFHTQFDLSELFVKTDIRMKGLNGELPQIVHYFRILIIFIPMLFSLGVLYYDNKIFKIILLVEAFLLILLNGSHLVEEVLKKPFDLSQGILLSICLLINLILLYELNKWRLLGKKKD